VAVFLIVFAMGSLARSSATFGACV